MTARAGQIHDTGYQPYVGERTAHAGRFLVIARNVIAVAWRGRGVKLALILTLLIVVAAAVWMNMAGSRTFNQLRQRGAPVPAVDAVVFLAVSYLNIGGFLISVLVGCGTVANDLKMGAFQFYFARPIRATDYVAGKLLGLFVLVGIPLFAGPVVLALLRMLMDSQGLIAGFGHIAIVPRAVLLGFVATAAFVLPAAGIGALMQSRVPAQALWAIYYFLIGFMANQAGQGLKLPWLRLVSATNDVLVVGRPLFGLDADPRDPPVWAAGVALAVVAGLGYYAIHWRVRRAETSGLGLG